MAQTQRLLLGMTTQEEQDYLETYAANEFTGVGDVVDLGCWLGSTTIPLARGMARNFRAVSRRVHAYDLFEWHPWMEPYAGELKGRYRQGESFLPEFERRIHDLSLDPWVTARAANLLEERWTGGPIEFLEVDAMKSWDLCLAIQRGFFPALVPGLSLVMHQDFKFLSASWIHLSMYELRDCFSVVRDLKESTSVVFRLEKPLPDGARGPTRGDDPWTSASIGDAYAYWRSVVSGGQNPHLDAAEVAALFLAGENAAGWRGLIKVVADGRMEFPQLLRFLGSRVEDVRKTFPVVRDLVPLDALIRIMANTRRAAWVWGAGRGGERLIAILGRRGVNVRGIFDSDAMKHGTERSGLRVARPDLGVVRESDGLVLVASVHGAAIAGQLRAMGAISGRDFVVADLGDLEALEREAVHM